MSEHELPFSPVWSNGLTTLWEAAVHVLTLTSNLASRRTRPIGLLSVSGGMLNPTHSLGLYHKDKTRPHIYFRQQNSEQMLFAPPGQHSCRRMPDEKISALTFSFTALAHSLTYAIEVPTGAGVDNGQWKLNGRGYRPTSTLRVVHCIQRMRQFTCNLLRWCVITMSALSVVQKKIRIQQKSYSDRWTSRWLKPRCWGYRINGKKLAKKLKKTLALFCQTWPFWNIKKLTVHFFRLPLMCARPFLLNNLLIIFLQCKRVTYFTFVCFSNSTTARKFMNRFWLIKICPKQSFRFRRQ